MPESSRRHKKRSKADKKHLSKRAVLALIDQFLETSDRSESDSETNSSDFDSEAENKKPARRQKRRRDERPPPRKRARKDREGHDQDDLNDSHPLSRSGSGPAWADADAIKALGQSIATTVRDAAPELLADEAVIRKLEVGLAKVVAEFAFAYGLGDSPKARRVREVGSASESDDELSPRVERRGSHFTKPSGHVEGPSVWDAPPLPKQRSQASPYDRSVWDAPPLPRRRDIGSSSRRLADRFSLQREMASTPRPSASRARMAHSAPREHSGRSPSVLRHPHYAGRQRDGRPARTPSRLREMHVGDSDHSEINYDEEDASVHEDEEEEEVELQARRTHKSPNGYVQFMDTVRDTGAAESSTRHSVVHLGTRPTSRNPSASWGPEDDTNIIRWAQKGLSWEYMAERLPPHSAEFIQTQYMALYESGALEEMSDPPPGSDAAAALEATNVDTSEVVTYGHPPWDRWTEEDKQKMARLAIDEGVPLAELRKIFPQRSYNALKGMLTRIRKYGVAAADRGRGRPEKTVQGVAATSMAERLAREQEAAAEEGD